MFFIQFVQALGRGIAITREEMKRNGNPTPELTVDQNLILSSKSLFFANFFRGPVGITDVTGFILTSDYWLLTPAAESRAMVLCILRTRKVD